MKSTRYVLIAGWVFVAMLAGCEPNIAHGDIDLDTTYFPFGLGYEWCTTYIAKKTFTNQSIMNIGIRLL